jgi:hypothetical protein
MWKYLHVKYPLFFANFIVTWIFSMDFRKKSSNIKFHQNPSSGSRAVPCGRKDRHFRNFANAPKKFLLPATVRLHTLLVLSHYFKRRYIFFKKREELSLVTQCRRIQGAEVQLHSFLTAALDTDEWSTSSTGSFIPGEELRYPLNRRSGGMPTCYGKQKDLLPLKGCDARTILPVTSSLYQLRYPGSKSQYKLSERKTAAFWLQIPKRY